MLTLDLIALTLHRSVRFRANHIELIAYSATQPNTGAAATALTDTTGMNSLVIKNNHSGGSPRIIQAWGMNQVAGFHQLTFPSGHDTTRGYRYNMPASEVDARLPWGISLEVQPQETISVTIAGSNTAGDVESGCFLCHYPNLPGVTQRLITWPQLLDRYSKLTTVVATLTGAAAGFTGTELITADSDLLRANTDYALMGITTNTECAAVFIQGPDTGFARVGVPGNDLDNDETSQYFCWMSRAFNEAFIPVINSGNKSATNLGFVQNENNVSPLVTLYLAQLKRGT